MAAIKRIDSKQLFLHIFLHGLEWKSGNGSFYQSYLLTFNIVFEFSLIKFVNKIILEEKQKV